MKERREFKRLPIQLIVDIDSLFKQGNEVISGMNEAIEVVDISRRGIGFLSKGDLPLDYYFDAQLQLGEMKFFNCVVKIIRKEKLDEGYRFGCVFVGLAECLAKKVDEYEASLIETE